MERRAEHKRLVKLYDQMRERLLDPSARNPLVSYKHRPTSRRQLRFVDTCLDDVYRRLIDGAAGMQIAPLPEPDSVPADERTPTFIGQLEHAKASDPIYLAKVEGLEALGSDADFELAAAERQLRDRLRASLGLPARTTLKAVSHAQHAETLGINPSFDLSVEASSAKHGSRGLQTLKWPDALDALLEKVSDEARLAEQEQGLSTLFLVFGFLEWFESDSSDKHHSAPLLLLPVKLEKRRTTGRKTIFTLSATAAGPDTNLSLKKRIERDFNRVLPDFDADEESAGSAEAYLQAVEEAIAGQKRWRVRRQLTLGHFAFGRLAMYAELDPDKWPEHPVQHTLVRSVLAGTEVTGDGGASLLAAPDDYQIDDPEIESIAPYLVHDADASQHSALIDVAKGKNLVIQGPPGTGKSQTITNVIANLLGSGRTVIFVAEKQAALEVVKRRMDKAGLGEFCLELHSDRSSPRRVVESLRSRHALGYGARNHVAAVPTLGPGWGEGRREISTYLTALHRPLDGGETPFSAIWRSVRARSSAALKLARFDDLKVPPDLLRDPSLQMRLQSDASVYCTMLQQYLGRHGPPTSSPWASIKIGQQVSSGGARSVVDDLVAHRHCAERAAAELASCFELGIQTLDEVESCESAIAQLPAEVSTQSVFSELVNADRTSVRDLVHRLKELRVLEADQRVLPPLDSASQLLLSAIRKTVEVARLEAGETQTPASFHDAAEVRARTFGEVAAILSDATMVLKAAGITGPSHGECALALARAVEILARIPRQQRAVALSLGGLKDDRFERVFDAWARLVENEAAWRGRFRFLGDQEWPNPDEIRRVAVLQRKNWVGRVATKLSGEQHLMDVMARQLAVPKNALPIADDLERLAGHIQELTAFEANRAYSQMFGVLWRGLDTPIAALHRDIVALRGLFDSMAMLKEGKVVIDQVRAFDEATIDSLVQHREPLFRLLALAPAHGQILGTHTIDQVASEGRRADGVLAKLRVADPDRSTHRFEQPLAVLERSYELEVRRRELNAHVQEHAPAFLVPILGSSLAELDSVERSLDWLDGLEAKQVPDALRDSLRKSASSVRAVRTLLVGSKTAATRFRASLVELYQNHGLDGLVSDDPQKAVEELDKLLQAANQLKDFLELRDQRQLLGGLGIDHILRRADEENIGPHALCDLLEALIATGRAHEARRTDRALARASGLRLDAHRKAFIEQDRRKINRDRTFIKNVLKNQTPPVGDRNGPKKTWTDLQLISNEFGKEKRFVPVRDLVRRAGRAMLAMKPCFMMSPLSLAKFVPPGSIQFDVLVIDEASQMRPEDALGGLLRVKQIVVVGDQKQLPPTDFFARSGATDQRTNGSSDDEDFEDVDDESILEVCQKTFNQTRMLRWHYRSRCESLISFSNQKFYRNELITFPSAQPGSFSVDLRKVEGAYEARRNPPEAQQIVAEAIAHMRDCADRNEDNLPTIGIVAVNTEQRELIKEEFRLRASQDERVERFCEKASARGEEFFVKNLENVQGDERDIILISLTYGPKPGQQTPHQRFGPINGKHGHRRLNVLFSRARDKVVLFSSLRADQIIANPGSREGVHVLKQYLEYAESGGQAVPEATGGTPDSDFEIEVRDRLRQRGYVVDTQVGVSGYKIDLGIRNPDRPQTYLAGVECDGASYHSSKSARDRDRLRQDCLKEKGWDLVRVWSTDWFDDPDGQMVKLIQQLESLRVAASEERTRNDAARAETICDSAQPLARAVVPINHGDEIEAPARDLTVSIANTPLDANTRDLDRITAMEEFQYAVATVSECGIDPNPSRFYEPTYVSALRRMVEHVIQVEGPLYEDVLVKRIARAHGFQRNGEQIVERVLGSVATRFPKTEEDGTAVLWPDGSDVRSLISFRMGGDREHGDIPLAELASLASRFLGTSPDTEAALRMMKDFFGLARLRETTRKRFEAAVALAKSASAGR